MLNGVLWVSSYVLTGLTVASASVSTISLVLWALPSFVTLEWRRDKFNAGPLGLSKRRRIPKSHGLLDVSSLNHWKQWAQRLSRSPRICLLKQTDKSWASNELSVKTMCASQLGIAHLSICIAHERRAFSFILLALLAGWFRFLIARLMTGDVDVYYDKQGTPVAWCQYIGKGNTLRAMWFYSANGQMLLWFLALRIGVQRAISSPWCHYFDAGPSSSASVEDLKTKYGLDNTQEWKTVCDYEGDYHGIVDVKQVLHDMMQEPVASVAT